MQLLGNYQLHGMAITEVIQRFQVSVLHYTKCLVLGINSALLEEGSSQAVL